MGLPASVLAHTPSTRQVIKVMAKIHYDDDDIHDKVVLWGKDAVFWTKYEGDLAYIERSIKPIGAPYIGEERVIGKALSYADVCLYALAYALRQSSNPLTGARVSPAHNECVSFA